MKILVLGGSSFSGRAFCRCARTNGDEVIELSRSGGYDIRSNLIDSAAHLVRSGYGRVVNFIALNVVAASWEHAAEYYQTNVVAMAALAECLQHLSPSKFVQVTTPEVYGNNSHLLDENAAFNPSTPYANSRAAADRHLQLLHAQYGFPVCFTRTVNVYGPGQQLYRIVPLTILSILRGEKLRLQAGGNASRRFIHVDDMANAIYRVLCDGALGEAYHACTPDEVVIRDLVRRICEYMGADFDALVEDGPDRPGKDPVYRLDDAKLRALGWQELTFLDHGLRKTIDWYRERFVEFRGAELDYRFAA